MVRRHPQRIKVNGKQRYTERNEREKAKRQREGKREGHTSDSGDGRERRRLETVTETERGSESRRWQKWESQAEQGAAKGGEGAWVTWVVVLYSSKALARLSAWHVRWESPKPMRLGPTSLRH